MSQAYTLATVEAKQFAVDINSQKGTIEALLPQHITYDRLARSALMSVTKTPSLLTCDRKSLILAVVQAAAWGLEPDTPLQQCHILPFKGKAVLIPGYRGLIKLAMQTGEIASIETRIAYENEDFQVEYGTSPHIVHRPKAPAERGDFKAVYGVVNMTDKRIAPVFDVMYKEDVDAIMKKSPSWQSWNKDKSKDCPWVSDYAQMARKTVAKRVLNYVPLSPEKSEILASAVQQDNMIERGGVGAIQVPPQAIDTLGEVVTVGEDPSKSDKLADQLSQESQSMVAESGRAIDELPL